MAGLAGLEPARVGIKIRCLTNLATWLQSNYFLAGDIGFEPITSASKANVLTC